MGLPKLPKELQAIAMIAFIPAPYCRTGEEEHVIVVRSNAYTPSIDGLIDGLSDNGQVHT